MKRQNEEHVHVFEQLFSLEKINNDVLGRILLHTGLSVNDIDRLCRSSAIIYVKCTKQRIWDRIFRNYVINGGNFADWKRSKRFMPNNFLRFMAFYATQGDEYRLTLESPSKAEAIRLALDNGKRRITYYRKMDNAFINNWKHAWMSENEWMQETDDELDMDKAAELAFDDFFGDDGYVWPYIQHEKPYFDTFGLELSAVHTKAPFKEMVYSLLETGWTPEHHHELTVHIGGILDENMPTELVQKIMLEMEPDGLGKTAMLNTKFRDIYESEKFKIQYVRKHKMKMRGTMLTAFSVHPGLMDDWIQLANIGPREDNFFKAVQSNTKLQKRHEWFLLQWLKVCLKEKIFDPEKQNYHFDDGRPAKIKYFIKTAKMDPLIYKWLLKDGKALVNNTTIDPTFLSKEHLTLLDKDGRYVFTKERDFNAGLRHEVQVLLRFLIIRKKMIPTKQNVQFCIAEKKLASLDYIIFYVDDDLEDVRLHAVKTSKELKMQSEQYQKMADVIMHGQHGGSEDDEELRKEMDEDEEEQRKEMEEAEPATKKQDTKPLEEQIKKLLV